MDSSFFAYLQQLELIAFFSGYPLLYTIVLSIAGKESLRNHFKKRIVAALPFAYALVATLYIGLQLKNLYPHYSLENIQELFAQPFLKIWGILAFLFWIPALSKRPVFSLLHSLVFFFLLLKDLIIHSASGGDRLVIKNDMKVYTDSLLVNACSFIAVAFISFIFFLLTSKKKNSHP